MIHSVLNDIYRYDEWRSVRLTLNHNKQALWQPNTGTEHFPEHFL